MTWWPAQREGLVLRAHLNRAPARNALGAAMMAALQKAFEAAAEDDSRVIVLAAEGPAFCAGHDLKEMTALRAEPDGGRAAFAAIFAQCSKLMQTIVRHPKPVIAQVQGIATAAGCQLVASCDLAHRLRERAVCDARREHRPVLLDPDGGAVAQCGAQACDGDAADRRNDFRRDARATSASSITSVPPDHARIGNHGAGATDRLKTARRLSRSARRHSTVSSRMPLSEAYDYASQVMTENMLAAESERRHLRLPRKAGTKMAGVECPAIRTN